MATNAAFIEDPSKVLVENETKKFESASGENGPRASAPPAEDAPPNYFDISIVPNGGILFNDNSIQTSGTSLAKIERNSKGVLSFDPLIDRNPDQMWLYFMTYLNEKPLFQVKVYGYYTEHYTTTRTTTDANGNSQTHFDHHTRDITEFSFSINASQFVNDRWWRIAVVPSKAALKTGQIVTVREAIEQYTRSDKKIKNIVLTKQVHGWDLTLLRGHILNLVRSTGYSNSIGIIFDFSNYQIEARSSSQLSQCANSTLVRVLCVLSCLWIVFGPIYCCLKAAGSTRDKIVGDYAFSRPMDTFLQLNASLIYNGVVSRSFANFAAIFQ